MKNRNLKGISCAVMVLLLIVLVLEFCFLRLMADKGGFISEPDFIIQSASLLPEEGDDILFEIKIKNEGGKVQRLECDFPFIWLNTSRGRFQLVEIRSENQEGIKNENYIPGGETAVGIYRIKLDEGDEKPDREQILKGSMKVQIMESFALRQNECKVKK